MFKTQTKTAGVILTALILAVSAIATGCGVNQAQSLIDSADETTDRTFDATIDSTSDVVENDTALTSDLETEAPTWEDKQELDRIEAERKALEQMQAKIARQQAELARTQQMLREQAREIEQAERVEETVDVPVEQFEPEQPIQSAPEVVLVNLPASTTLLAEFGQMISSKNGEIGQPVQAYVTEDVVRGDLTVIPAGSRLNGRIAEIVQPQRKVGGTAAMRIDFDSLEFVSGQTVAVQASLYETQKQTKKDATTIGGAAAGGAVLGRILKDEDRDKGTIVGAILGAAIGTAVAAKNKAAPVEIEAGQLVEVTLDSTTQIAVQLDETFESDGELASVRSFPQRTR